MPEKLRERWSFNFRGSSSAVEPGPVKALVVGSIPACPSPPPPRRTSAPYGCSAASRWSAIDVVGMAFLKGNMKFFSLEDSKKLAEMGCRSESKFIWVDSRLFPSELIREEDEHDIHQAFTAYDFLGDSEQARRNCEILWKDEPAYCDSCWRHHEHNADCDMGCGNNMIGWEFMRLKMLMSPDHIEFVRGFLR